MRRMYYNSIIDNTDNLSLLIYLPCSTTARVELTVI